ncbi:hypothetical protein DOY81_004608 [Sarcophaga bullata]|nr:hypothetical protein DOY81_004608 [Sarcophaga bullata]
MISALSPLKAEPPLLFIYFKNQKISVSTIQFKTVADLENIVSSATKRK